ncbi:MAG: hypothetical protein EOP45_19780 [Sphingobacteriaceae bacterium]|nr:MAG: hypothetical protein EOP45_19780 [Sphingobacteriaceae bacterium]
MILDLYKRVLEKLEITNMICHVPPNKSLMISTQDVTIFLQVLLVVILDSDPYYKKHHDRICHLIQRLHTNDKTELSEAVRQIEIFVSTEACLHHEIRGQAYSPKNQRILEYIYREFDTTNTLVRRFCELPSNFVSNLVRRRSPYIA